MKRKLLYLIIYLTLSAEGLYAQAFPLPKDFKFDVRLGAHAYTQYVIPCITWLQQTPLAQHREDRFRINIFVLTLLQTNPDINKVMPEYSYAFHGINDQ